MSHILDLWYFGAVTVIDVIAAVADERPGWRVLYAVFAAGSGFMFAANQGWVLN